MAGRFDRVAFRSDRLPIDHFDARFSEENVSFWVPRLVRAAQITPGLDVLDVGCGTGGFARAIACSVPARVTGCDRSERFIEFAKRLPRPPPGTLGWVVGDAERLPFDASAFDRVLLSLVLHQLTDPGAAVAEAFRVLPGGAWCSRGRLRQPRMAAADAARMPRLDAVRADAARGDWIDPRPTYMIVAARPQSAPT